MNKNGTQYAAEFAEAALMALARRIEQDYGFEVTLAASVNIHPKGDAKTKERVREIARDLGLYEERGGPGRGFATFETPEAGLYLRNPVKISVFHNGF